MKLTYLCLFNALVVGSAYAQSGDLAVVGAKIEIGNGTVIEAGNIIIHDGKISAVGTSVAVPSGAKVIDGKGLVVYPGFIDGYTTEGLNVPSQPSYGTAPDSNTTAPATMWHANRKGIRADIVAAKCLDIKGQLTSNYAQGVTTALLSSGSGTVRGNAAVIDYVGTGNAVKALAGTELSFRSGSGQGYPGTLFGVIATLRQTLADAQYYASNPAPATDPKAADAKAADTKAKDPAKDPNMENLKPLMTNQTGALWFANTAREISRAERLSDEFKFKLTVLGATEAYRNIPLLKAKGTPVIVNIDPGFEPSRKAEASPGSAPQAVLDERHDVWAEHTRNVKKLNEAGVPFAFCTGGSNLSDYLKNVRKIVSDGLPRDAALKALTLGAAQILGIDGEVGTIEAGKRANLVLMSGDFAGEKSEVVSVVVDGTSVDVKKGGAK